MKSIKIKLKTFSDMDAITSNHVNLLIPGEWRSGDDRRAPARPAEVEAGLQLQLKLLPEDLLL